MNCACQPERRNTRIKPLPVAQIFYRESEAIEVLFSLFTLKCIGTSLKLRGENHSCTLSPRPTTEKDLWLVRGRTIMIGLSTGLYSSHSPSRLERSLITLALTLPADRIVALLITVYDTTRNRIMSAFSLLNFLTRISHSVNFSPSSSGPAFHVLHFQSVCGNCNGLFLSCSTRPTTKFKMAASELCLMNWLRWKCGIFLS
jgi:hypothetical protein